MPIRSRCQLCNAVIEYAADSLAEAVFVNCPTCGEETEIRPITVGGGLQPAQFQVAEPPRPKSPWRQDGPLVLTLVGVGAAIGNAVSAALATLGVNVTRLPLSPNNLTQLIREARS